MSVDQVIVVGASAGGVEALLSLMRELGDGVSAPICIVIHQPRNMPSVLPKLLARAGSLPVVHAEDRMALEAGRVYVAPPNQHMLVGPGGLRLEYGPPEHGHRPAIDPLFRSAAEAFGARATAVVLSGSLDDGSRGARAVRDAGGRVLIQDPDDALYAEMPRNAIRSVGTPDEVLPIPELAVALHRPVSPGEGGDGPDGSRRAPNPGRFDPREQPDLEDPIQRSSLSCPNCGGPMHEEAGDEGPADVGPRFRCRIGHAWSMDSLYAGQSAPIEVAMWAAVRVLEERASLVHRLIDRATHRGQHRAAERFRHDAREIERHARELRRSIDGLGPLLGPLTSAAGTPLQADAGQ